MAEGIKSRFKVSFNGNLSRQILRTKPPSSAPKESDLLAMLKRSVDDLDELQRLLFASNRFSLLLIFQAMDAAGKDSTIRAVMRGVDPAGCQVFSFKQPSAEELDHDFLWRCVRCLPERGRIGIFNRSYYEEVLVVKVHPDYLEKQNLPVMKNLERLWKQRYESIRRFEEHLARSGTMIVKFWLNLSKDEQRKRFLSRLEEPHKVWKFGPADVAERRYWKDYQHAYVQALRETSRPWAPWYAIPADNKAYMQAQVAQIVVKSLQSLKLSYPKVKKKELALLEDIKRKLLDEAC